MIVVSGKDTFNVSNRGDQCKKLTRQAIGVMGSQRDQVTKQSGQEASALPKPGGITRGMLRTPGVSVTQ